MNKRPIESARDTDLRLAAVALRRAAQRARELAIQTGTVLIVRDPEQASALPANTQSERVNEPPADYRNTP